MSQELTVIEQRAVTFYDDELTAVRADDGHVYVSLRRVCESLGVDTQAQTRRVRRQRVLERGLQRVAILTTHRGKQQTYMLRVDLLPLFLSGISTKSVKEDSRDKLEKFQEEAAAVLWEAFQEGRLTTDPEFDDLLQSDSDAVQAYKMLQALVKLARHQILLESRLDSHDSQLAEVGTRLEELEAAIAHPSALITEDQASQVSQAVKTVAILQGKQTKRNEFGAVYGELYRKFGITSYKSLPAARFEEALKFLNEWRESLSDDAF